MLDSAIWTQCLDYLKTEITSKEFNLWILPLKAHVDQNEIILYAPNRYMVNWVSDKYLDKILSVIETLAQPDRPRLLIKEQDLSADVSARAPRLNSNAPVDQKVNGTTTQAIAQAVTTDLEALMNISHKVNAKQRFDNFVEGKSNQLAVAAAKNVAENPGKSYNPFYIFGASGLGKTHLLHSIGNMILDSNPNAKVAIMHSERFVQDMVKAVRLNKMTEFQTYYRSFDALLIDDIQFFAKKDRSQEEFFHTFNALLEGGKQIILTSDSYPREIDGIEDRLKSRFGWGLTVEVEPPELETRAAILIKKAEEKNVQLSNEVAMFIAARLRSNVRELEGALNRVIANSNFTGNPITVDFVREALRDLISMQEKLITVENIKEAVAKYYNVSVKDLHSARRSRSIARPRQIAMALSRELTNQSLPEIGDSFGGRDHTTVIHACRQIKKLCEEDFQIKEDYSNLVRKFEP